MTAAWLYLLLGGEIFWVENGKVSPRCGRGFYRCECRCPSISPNQTRTEQTTNGYFWWESFKGIITPCPVGTCPTHVQALLMHPNPEHHHVLPVRSWASFCTCWHSSVWFLQHWLQRQGQKQVVKKQSHSVFEASSVVISSLIYTLACCGVCVLRCGVCLVVLPMDSPLLVSHLEIYSS